MRTQRDIQIDKALNDLRKSLVDIFEKYNQLKPQDSLIILSELSRSEAHIVKIHVDKLEEGKK